MSAGRQYKVIYHLGEKLELATRMKSAKAHVEGQYLYLNGANPLTIHLSELTKMQLYRHHGVGSMIKCEYEDSSLFFTVVRLNIFGFFSIINFFGTRELYQELDNNGVPGFHLP